VVPRLRYTPYHRMRPGIAPHAETDLRDRINARTRSADHQPLRELIVRWVEATGRRALLCPEMTYEVEVAREELLDPLPASVRAKVKWLDRYWLHDEAAAVYARAFAVVSLENHSPILALAQGTPTLFVRQPTDTIKGKMWRDIGMDEWFSEVEQTTGDLLWERLDAMRRDYPAALRKAQGYRDTALRRLQEMTLETVAAARG